MYSVSLSRLVRLSFLWMITLTILGGVPLSHAHPLEANSSTPSRQYALHQPGGALLQPDLAPVFADNRLAHQAAQAERAIYIVHLAEPPLAAYDGGISGFAPTSPQVTGERKLNTRSSSSHDYLHFLSSRQAHIKTTARQRIKRPPRVVATFSIAFHGMAMELTPQEADSIAQLPGVLRVEREVVRAIQTDVGPSWIGAPGIWDGSATGNLPGTRGEGIIVGILDTGINMDHPSFAAQGDDGYGYVNPLGDQVYTGWCNQGHPNYSPTLRLKCNAKLIGVYSYPTSRLNPEDDNGHGSHVASTSAGNVIISPTLRGYNDTLLTLPHISGIAPHANIISYDVCTDITACPDSATLLALDDAIRDGVDVINYSIGGGSYDPWLESSAAQAFLNARAAGIFVSESAANRGPDPKTVGAPAGSPWIIAAGAATHKVSIQPVTSNVPDQLTVFAQRTADSYRISNVRAMTITELAAHSALVRGIPSTFSPAVDISPGDPFDDLSQGVAFTTMMVPSGSRQVIAEVTGWDLIQPALFVGHDTNGDGKPGSDEVLCSRYEMASLKCVIKAPEAGTYWVLAQNRGQTGPGAGGVQARSAELSEPYITVTTAVVPGTATDNLRVVGPHAVAAGEPFDLHLLWDLADGQPLDYWYGIVDLGTAPDAVGDLGTIDLRLQQGYGEVMKRVSLTQSQPGDTLTYTLSIAPTSFATQSGGTTYALTDTLPPGLTYVPDSASANVEVTGNQLTFSGIVTTYLEITYQATVDATVVRPTILTNTVVHTVNRLGTRAETASAAVELPPVSFRILKTGPTEVETGQPIMYTLTVTNTGINPAAALVISDTLPANVRYIRGGQLIDSTVQWQVDMLAAGVATQVQYAVMPQTPPSRSSRNRPKVAPSPQIVGGKPAEPGKWPWQAALVYASEENAWQGQYCGGSLISPDWVLTAAHCLLNDIGTPLQPDDIDVVLGRYALSSNEGERIDISRILIHPAYDDIALDYDIGLLRLARPSQQPTIALAALGDRALFAPGILATVTGWGSLDPQGKEYPDALYEVAMPIIPNELCNALYEAADYGENPVTAQMLCAGSQAGGKDACRGDSGGPLVVANGTGTGYLQVGIASWGGEVCGQAELYGVYTSVPRLRSWVLAQLTLGQRIVNDTYQVRSAGGYSAVGTVPVVTLVDIVPPESVSIAGPATGTVATEAVYTAVAVPISTTTPLIYRWTPPPLTGQGSATAHYLWREFSIQQVNVIVSNSGGFTSDSRQVTIKPLIVELTGGPTRTKVGSLVTLTAMLNALPSNSAGAELLINPGDGSDAIVYNLPLPDTNHAQVIHQYTRTGLFTATAEVYSSIYYEQLASDSLPIIVSSDAPPTITVTAVANTLPADGRSTTTITAQVLDAQNRPLPDQVVTFSTTAGTVDPIAGTTAADGFVTTTLTAASIPITATVTARSGILSANIAVRFVMPPAGVTIDGLASGLTHITYPFTATTRPENTTRPIQYTWEPEPESGQGTAEVQYRWEIIGTQSITVTAANEIGVVSGTHTINISETRQPMDEIIVTPETGGTLTISDATKVLFQVQVPPGAVSETVTLRYTPLSGVPEPPLPNSWQFVGPRFLLQVFQSGTLLPSYHFKLPITLRISYDTSTFTTTDQLLLVRYSSVNGQWEDASVGIPIVSGGSFITQIDNLNQFALVRQQQRPTEQETIYLPLVRQ